MVTIETLLNYRILLQAIVIV